MSPRHGLRRSDRKTHSHSYGRSRRKRDEKYIQSCECRAQEWAGIWINIAVAVLIASYTYAILRQAWSLVPARHGATRAIHPQARTFPYPNGLWSVNHLDPLLRGFHHDAIRTNDELNRCRRVQEEVQHVRCGERINSCSKISRRQCPSPANSCDSYSGLGVRID